MVTSLAETLDNLPVDRQREVVRMIVDSVTGKGKGISLDRLVWTGPVQTLFALDAAPRTDSNPQFQRSVLDWYLEVG